MPKQPAEAFTQESNSMSNTRIAAIALCLAAPFAAHAGELIVNGSFEDPGVNAGTWSILKNMPGWTASGSGIEVRNGVAGTTPFGNNFVELDTHHANSNSWMAQTVTTDIGKRYTLSYHYSPRAGVAGNSNDITVSWNGIALTTNAGSGVGNSNHVWQMFSHTVKGTGSDTVSFMAGGLQDTYGGSIDNVSLMAAVPEPGTYALLAAGLAAVGFVARRRSAGHSQA